MGRYELLAQSTYADFFLGEDALHYSAQNDELEKGTWIKSLSRAGAVFSHIPALSTSPSTQRESLSDTPCETVPHHPFQMRRYMNRAPTVWLQFKIDYMIFLANVCATLKQNNSRICDV